MNTLRVIDSGPFTAIQDAGRWGYQKFGLTVSGAMDALALRAANLLVGNDEDAAAIEIGAGGLTLEVEMPRRGVATEPCLIALTGFKCEVFVQERAMPAWGTIFVRRGWTIQVVNRGGWAYLAIAGGIQTQPVLGSRSTYLRGGLGGLNGRALAVGDEIPIGSARRDLQALVGREIPTSRRPAYTGSPTLEVILGPQDDRFTESGIQTFLSSEYAVSLTSDRMGYRLEGPPIEHGAGADIISDGIVFGAVQVPANGQPIIMMSDHPTTGGYAKIATVIGANMPLLAQCPIGGGRVRFRATTVEAAQTRYREIMRALRESVTAPDEYAF